MADEFDPSLYVRAPKMDVRGGLTLAQKLVAAAPRTAAEGEEAAPRTKKTAKGGKKVPKTDPRDPPPAVVEARDEMILSYSQLRTLWNAVDEATRNKDLRPMDKATDGVWNSTFQRCETYSSLPADRYPNAARAAALVQTLFPDGMGFLSDGYDQQYAVMDKVIARIVEKGLRGELEAIAGADFVAELFRTHAIYGEAIGATKKKQDRVEAPQLLQPLLGLAKAIGAYSFQVAAWHQGTRDEAVRKTARAALLPIDEYRAAQARRSPDRTDKGEKAAEGDGGTEPAAGPAPVPAPKVAEG